MKLFRIVASMTLMFGMYFSMYAVPDVNETNVGTQREAKNNSDDTVSLVTSGTGKSKEEATNNALRSALEQAYGTFVSSNTQIVNDEVIKDDIVSMSAGNIQNYKELSCIIMQDGLYDVTVNAIVSIGKLVSFAESHGASIELAGNTFLKNRNLAILNKNNEGEAIIHLIEKIAYIADRGLYDFSLDIGDPQSVDDKFAIGVKVKAQPNANMTEFFNIIRETLNGLTMSKEEINSFEELGIERGWSGQRFEFDIRSEDTGDDNNHRGGWNIKNFKPIYADLRSSYDVQNTLTNYINFILNVSRNSFVITDNLGLSIIPHYILCNKSVINDIRAYRYYYYDREKDLVMLLLERPVNDLRNPPFERGRWEDFKIIYTNDQMSKLTKISIEPELIHNVENLANSGSVPGVWESAVFYSRLEDICLGVKQKEKAEYHNEYFECISALKDYFQKNPLTQEFIDTWGNQIKIVNE